LGPALYITPDNYLRDQATAEAADLGINVTDNEQDPAFLNGGAILVANIWKLINARSVFGVRDEGIKIPIGAIVVDDAHACLATVASQFSLRLEADHPVYKELLALFREELERQSPVSVLDIEAGDPRALPTVSFWAWKDRQTEVLKIIHPHRKEKEFEWVWPLIGSVLPQCQCIFGGGSLEIAPPVFAGG
jgi:hypothetical protein